MVDRGAVIAEAKTWLGVPYRWSGTTRDGVDCSGFTRAVYARFGVKLPRVSAAQAMTGKRTTLAAAQPGDLVAFGAVVHHVGIYLGGGRIIHAPHTGAVVRIEQVWQTEPVTVRNVLGDARTSSVKPPEPLHSTSLHRAGDLVGGGLGLAGGGLAGGALGWALGDEAGAAAEGVLGGDLSGVRDLVLTALVVLAGGALVTVGAFYATAPARKKMTDAALDVAGTVQPEIGLATTAAKTIRK